MPDKLQQQLEAVLFVAATPVTARQLAQACQTEVKPTTAALEALGRSLQNRGLRLIHSGDRYSLVTAESATAAVERFLGIQMRTELTKPALETLAIVAYRQPVTRADIEDIRGVSSEQTLKNLLVRGLITETGRSQTPGQPRLYATTTRFLQQLGLDDVSQLPPVAINTRSKHAA